MASKSKSTVSKTPVLPVAEGETPWTPDEIAGLRIRLEAEVEQTRIDLAEVEQELAGRMSEGPDGAGKDPADVGASNFERDQELSVATNVRVVLDQAEMALQHFNNGSYGTCELCAKPIGKMRLSAFPRATLCLSCKQREERR
ncbi:MAG: TraR/DksA C4-type zinc finger protein [Propionibacteriaceae bacterium]|jgi:DnaK suppressor protein|nr:TraR/DksA C4-type zinc finger protein [Propionibacteriaceae bacterium]